MGQEIKVTGLVLQTENIGEYDRRIVLLTKERGRISAFARGAKKATSPYAAACQPFTFGKFSLYEGKNSFNLMWAEVDNYFDNLKKDLDLSPGVLGHWNLFLGLSTSALAVINY